MLPVPASASEEPATLRTTRTHCPYCAFQCGMRLSTREGAPPTVAGDPEFPVSRGRMCVKGFTSAELLDHPARLETPLLRTAAGALAPASWDEALGFVATRLETLRARHGAGSLAVFGSGALTNEKAYLLGKFARVVLRTPHIDYNGRYCMSSAAAGQNRAFGLDRGLPFPVADLADADTLVLWGANPAETMPPLLPLVHAQRAHGALVVVDPRRTETARLATLHLQPTPGTDLALANGLLHLAIEEGLVDADYVAARTEGFEALRRSVATCEPVWVERVTGVPVAQQRAAIALVGGAARSMLLSGRGPEQQSKGTDTVLALCNLMLALGKVGKPASGYGCLTGQGNGQGGREHGQKADQLPGYRSIVDPADRAAIAAIWGVSPGDLPGKGLSAAELLGALGPQGGLRALLVFGSNLAVASANARAVEQGLRELELLVVADAFENETTRAAHVVLPVAQWAEEEGTMTNLEGRVILRRRARRPPPWVRTDLEILTELAARLGEGARFAHGADAAAVFDELARATRGARADYGGLDHARLAASHGIHWPCPEKDHPGTPRLFEERFAHPSGRARFHVVPYRPAAELPDAAYPLHFTTGRHKEHYNSGAQTRRVGALVAARGEARVELHPRLAAQLGVVDGGWLLIESRRGAVRLRARLSFDIRPDTLFAPFHWGGRDLVNQLTHAALDPTSGMPELKVCAVRACAVPTEVA